MSEFSLKVVIEDVIALLESCARANRVKIELEFGDALPKVTLPEASTSQILYNILENALQASDEGSSVEVSTSVKDQEILIAVRDSGQGISTELQDRIFESFLTTKRNQRESGLGLGLSISKSLVEKIGGYLKFESEEGKGTTFWISLPRFMKDAEVSTDA